MKTLTLLLALALPSAAQVAPKTLKVTDTTTTTYTTQPTIDGKIILNANNGFFDKGLFRAEKPSPAPAEDTDYIKQHFNNLTYTSTNSNGSARWYIYTTKPGQLTLTPSITSETPEQWQITIDAETKPLDLTKNTPLTFTLKTLGKKCITLTRLTKGQPKNLKINTLTLSGPAAETSKLIRARWRPAAVHTRYASSTCPTTKLWVFETQTLTPTSNYSPMTTAFGYFGATFNADKKASGGINFSMWSASQNAKTAPPLASSPRLIATGNPKASFSGFGHEGSGVKIRDWSPFSHHPASVIQALRLETGPEYNTYYGYIYNEPTQSWILYAAGQKPHKGKKSPTSLRTTSFCEVPGPPAVERTGDQPRLIRRRGWVTDQNNQWHPIDQIHFKNKGNQPTSKTIGSQPGGWLTMGTGGVDLHTPKTTIKITPPKTLPPYLSPEKTKQLHTLPTTYKTNTTTQITNTTATITYTLKNAGTNPTAILYYGEKDAITSIPRQLHGTEKKGVSSQMLAPDRVWQHQTKPTPITNNTIKFNLTNLKPNTQYHHRILTTNDQGKTWHPTTNTFTTK